MREIRTSGSMSGERKRSDAAWRKPPRLSSTLLGGQTKTAAQENRRFTENFGKEEYYATVIPRVTDHDP